MFASMVLVRAARDKDLVWEYKKQMGCLGSYSPYHFTVELCEKRPSSADPVIPATAETGGSTRGGLTFGSWMLQLKPNRILLVSDFISAIARREARAPRAYRELSSSSPINNVRFGFTCRVLCLLEVRVSSSLSTGCGDVASLAYWSRMSLSLSTVGGDVTSLVYWSRDVTFLVCWNT